MVEITQADRDAYDCLMYDENYDHPPHGAWHFARHRHTATADALEAMREARTAIKNMREWVYGWDANFLSDADWPADDKQARDALARLTAAIAKIEGDTK